jgi:hypothetical protein
LSVFTDKSIPSHQIISPKPVRICHQVIRGKFALRSDRTMKALTGLSRVEFQLLCPVFDQALSKQIQSRRPDRQRKPGGGGKYRLGPVEAKLFFILM